MAAEALDASPSRRPATTKRKKKPTYTVRKEEKRRLEQDLAALTSELESLKRKHAAAASEGKPQYKKPRALLSTDDVREATRRQEASLVSVHSALSSFVTAQTHLPFEMWIHLGTDAAERRETLAALKLRRLRAGEQFLRERARFLDPLRSFAEHSRFDSREGDLCALRFDVTPFEGVASAWKVFDALGHYFANMEIWLTETLGDVTVREDDDSAGRGVSQLRLRSSLPCGAQLEMNKVLYSDYFAGGEGDGGYGVYTADFVDKDELFPYRAAERLRLDVTGALTVREVKRPAGGDARGAPGETVVVVTRVCLVRLRTASVALPPGAIHELREGVGTWEDVMLRTVRQLVYR